MFDWLERRGDRSMRGPLVTFVAMVVAWSLTDGNSVAVGAVLVVCLSVIALTYRLRRRAATRRAASHRQLGDVN
jgi:hypothetical protein